MSLYVPPIPPMKAKPADIDTLEKLSNTETWGAGEKFDGQREILYLGKTRNELLSSEGNSHIDRVPQFQIVVPSLAGTAIDCEGLSPTRLRKDTASCFRSLPENAIAWQEENGKATLVGFDCLYYCGYSLMDVPLLGHRIDALKEVVETLVKAGMPIRREELVIKDKLSYYKMITSRTREEGNEGIILKNLHVPYEAGKRSNFWLKVKKMVTIVATIIGFNPGVGKFEDMVGSLEFRTKSGISGSASGMDDSTRQFITDHSHKYLGREAYFEGQFITEGKSLMHPQYKGLVSETTTPSNLLKEGDY